MANPGGAPLALAVTMALTFVTGVVDAVGFLALDRVFTGNMTGNIVILGMGVAGADELPVLGPAVALAGFTVGAFGAGLVLRQQRSGDRWDRRYTLLLMQGAVTLLTLTVVAAVVEQQPGSALQIGMATATAAVMGQQAMVARALAVKDMTTVVVTSTLASLAGETWVRRAPGAVLNRRFAAIGVIFVGAVAGALLLRIHLAVPFGVAAAVTVLAVCVGHLYLSDRREHRPCGSRGTPCDLHRTSGHAGLDQIGPRS